MSFEGSYNETMVEKEHPGWRTTVRSDAFQVWLHAQTASTARLASSHNWKDAVELLNRYKSCAILPKARPQSTTPLLDEFLKPGPCWVDAGPHSPSIAELGEVMDELKKQVQLHCGMTPDMMREVERAAAVRPPYRFEKKLLLTRGR